MMLNLVVTMGVLYGCVVGGLSLFQRRLIYLPATRPADREAAGALDWDSIAVTAADGVQVTGWYRAPADSSFPVVVYFHGIGGSIAHRVGKARRFLDRGYGVLLAGYRGYGGNPGTPTEPGLYRDGRAYLDHLARLAIPPERTVLFGESLGTAVAVQMATERPVGAVVLEAPFTSLADAAAVHYPWAPVHLLLLDRYDSIAKIDRIAAPLLIVHGSWDLVVPTEHGRRLLERAVGQKTGVFLPLAGHNDIFDFGGTEAVFEFLAAQFPRLKPAARARA